MSQAVSRRASLLSSVLDPRSVQVGFVVDKEAL